MELYYKIENDYHIVLHLLFDLLIGLFLFLFTFSCLKVSALEVYSGNMSGNQSNVFVVDNLETNVDYNFNPIFHDTTALGTSGYIHFTMSFNKVSGSATSPVVTARGVAVTIGDTAFVCDIGSNNLTNSTFNESTYTVVCPVNMVGGLHRVYVALNDLQTNDLSSYRIRIGNGVSYERVEGTSVNVNVNTSGIIDNQTQNTQDIIDSQEELADDIIDNQTQNTQDMIDSQKVCSNVHIDKSTGNFVGNLNGSGELIVNSGYSTTDFMPIGIDTTIKIVDSVSYNARVCFYNSSKINISCINASGLSSGTSLTIPSNASYVRFTVITSSNKPTYDFYTCRNGNQAIADNQQQINDALTNHDISDIDLDFFDEITQSSDTPISDLLTMPLLYLNKLIDILDGSSCVDYTIPFDFTGGSNTLTFPCLNLGQKLGSTLWSAIDLILCGMMVYNIGMMVVHFYENWSSLQDTFDDLYVPKHTYHPKHGGA